METMNVYEIILKEDVSILTCLEDMKKLGQFSLNDNRFYLHTSYKKATILKKIVNIKEINNVNLQYCNNIDNSFCREFCINCLTTDEVKQFENSNQKQLEEINKKLDFLINLKDSGKLNEYLKNIMNQEVGDDIAERKTKENSTV